MFLAGTGAVLLTPPLAAEAQPMEKVAFLCPDSCSNLPNTQAEWDRSF